MVDHGIELKTAPELERLRVSGALAAQVLHEIARNVRPGIATFDLEEIAVAAIRRLRCKAAFRGYRGYPAATCISLNHEVVHGIPSKKRIIASGDIVSIDIGIVFEGFYGDNAVSVIAGSANHEDERLLTVTRDALYAGIEKAVLGNRLGDISAAIQHTAESNGYAVVRDYVGHGIGRAMHEPPQIPNYGTPGTGPRLETGMVLALEPMINQGLYNVAVMDDGWTVVTQDGRKSAHFEHMIAITEDGPEILTRV
ncbi:MAG: type I methionyl aminopeptidase [Elusimicrobia bacterium]|nr:type I methionyl aminopeptidase [Elusimicrobiota bacterium]MBD3412634.1 type I methionyl aminopeptidase [Elusimicrobiota bacterium]